MPIKSVLEETESLLILTFNRSTMTNLKFLFSFFLLFTTLLSSAQVQTFGGTIIDERTERAVEELELTVEHLGTHKKYVTETNDEGKFSFKQLPVGKYQLVITDRDYIKAPFNFEATETHKPNLDFAVSLKVSWMMNWGDAFGKEHYWSHLICLLYTSPSPRDRG